MSTTSARQGTRSTTCTPAFSTASTFSGLFDISRTAFSPKNCRIAPGSSVVAQVAVEPELLVGFDGVRALVLQFVGAQFVEQPDAAAFLEFVDQQSPPFLRDAGKSDFELRPAIAAQAVEHIPRQALRMDPHQRRRSVCEVTHFEHHGFLRAVARGGFKAEDPEHAELGGKIRFGHFREPGRKGFTHANLWEP